MPMGAGRRQSESFALCVWQCHLRNVSTLSNRTPSGRFEPSAMFEAIDTHAIMGGGDSPRVVERWGEAAYAFQSMVNF